MKVDVSPPPSSKGDLPSLPALARAHTLSMQHQNWLAHAATCSTWGHLAGASLALGGYMAHGYTKTRKLFPQGVFAGLSLTLALAYISQGLG